MPGGGDKCQNCFFAFLVPASGGDLAGKYTCNFYPPRLGDNKVQWPFLWPVVEADWWCGEGRDDSNGRPFAPTPLVPGVKTFTLNNESSIVVTDADCLPNSVITYWLISGSGSGNFGSPLHIVPGTGSFTVTAPYPVTATYGYKIS